jgi:hypothetical protein
VSRNGLQAYRSRADPSTPNGRGSCFALLAADFDGSKGGWHYVSYRRAGTLELVDDEATLQRFYRPGLMGLLVKGQKLTR